MLNRCGWDRAVLQWYQIQRFYESKEESSTKGASKGFVIKMSISKWHVFKINGDEYIILNNPHYGWGWFRSTLQKMQGLSKV